MELRAKAMPVLAAHGRGLGMDVLFTLTSTTDPTQTSATELQERLEVGEPVLYLAVASAGGDAPAV